VWPRVAKYRSRQFRETRGRAAQGIPSEAFLNELPILRDPNLKLPNRFTKAGTISGSTCRRCPTTRAIGKPSAATKSAGFKLPLPVWAIDHLEANRQPVDASQDGRRVQASGSQGFLQLETISGSILGER
jgi:hypothetical protein